MIELSVKDAEDALAGDFQSLIFAFTWEDTPEGFDFWSNQAETGLTEEGRAILEKMLTEAKNETGSN